MSGAVANEDRQGHLDEISRAVVERHRDARLAPLTPHCLQRFLEADHVAGVGEGCHLLVEHRGREIDR